LEEILCKKHKCVSYVTQYSFSPQKN
jgi:hypothetical protein